MPRLPRPFRKFDTWGGAASIKSSQKYSTVEKNLREKKIFARDEAKKISTSSSFRNIT